MRAAVGREQNLLETVYNKEQLISFCDGGEDGDDHRRSDASSGTADLNARNDRQQDRAVDTKGDNSTDKIRL